MARLLPPIHPGEILTEEFLSPMGITRNKLAIDLGIPARPHPFADREGETLDLPPRRGAPASPLPTSENLSSVLDEPAVLL